MQKAFDDRYQVDNLVTDIASLAASMNARGAAEQKLNAEIENMLGSRQTAAAHRNSDADFQTLQALADKLDLPAGTSESLYALRDTITAQADKLKEDPVIPPEERAVRQLALIAQVQANLGKALGAEAATYYMQRAQWCQALQPTEIITLNAPNGFGSLAPR